MKLFLRNRVDTFQVIDHDLHAEMVKSDVEQLGKDLILELCGSRKLEHLYWQVMILSDHGTILPTGNTSQKECSNNLLYRDRIHPVLIEGGTSIFRPIYNVKLQMILQVRTNAF